MFHIGTGDHASCCVGYLNDLGLLSLLVGLSGYLLQLVFLVEHAPTNLACKLRRGGCSCRETRCTWQLDTLLWLLKRVCGRKR